MENLAAYSLVFVLVVLFMFPVLISRIEDWFEKREAEAELRSGGDLFTESEQKEKE